MCHQITSDSLFIVDLGGFLQFSHIIVMLEDYATANLVASEESPAFAFQAV